VAESPTELSDNELVKLALRDRQQFGVLYDRYATRVYRFCYRRLDGRFEAEDATSTIFMRALERLPSFRDGSFAAWLFAIARTTVTDRHRARLVLPLPETHDQVDPDPSPSDQAIAAEAARTVHGLLGSLPGDQREVIELRLAGLSGAEIAEAMDRSVAAVKMLQLRAMKRLKELTAGEIREER
jgi:RNA polymerase sigma-70 factor (ECF subfamily)